MTPREAVIILAEVVASRDEFTEDDLYAALSRASVPDDLADRTYKLTQIAWGRFFLSGLGVTFSEAFYWLNANGQIVSSGVLSNEPSYAVALSLAERYAPYPGFHQLALMSADVQAVNQLLKKGSKPEDLQGAPAVMFTEPPSPQGMASADRLLAEGLAPQTPHNATRERRPWWKLW